MMLYKYRTLDNFQFLMDIIVNNRLFAAKFDDMNDPMEGSYTTKDLVDRAFHEELKKNIGAIKICSLSKSADEPLMWAHYTNGNRGCVIGLELPKNTKSMPVNYDGPSRINLSRELPPAERAKRVLTYKNDFWIYEKEVRTFVEDGNYQQVIIREITFGEKVDRTAVSIIKKIIEKVAPAIVIIERKKG